MRKPSPLIRLKVPKGSFKIANENGILKEFLFYHRLKSLRIDGYFKRGTITQYAEKLGCSTSLLYNQVAKLQKYKFIEKTPDKGLQLVSYDKLWSLLGFDIKDRKSLRLFRVAPGADLKHKLYTHEIDCNLKSQEKAIIKAHIYKEAGRNPDTDTMPSGVHRALKRQKIKHKVKLREQYLHIRETFSLPDVNYDISLSCERIASLLGFGSAMQGSLIQKELKERGMINSINRPAVFFSDKLKPEQLKSLKHDNPAHPVISRLFMTGKGVTLLRRCNLIEVNPLAVLDPFYTNFYKLHAKHSAGRSRKESCRKEKEQESEVIIGKQNISNYEKDNSSPMYSNNINNKIIKTKQSDQYYINLNTMRLGKLHST